MNEHAACCAALAFALLAMPAAQGAPPRAARAAGAVDGKAVYDYFCYQCHGYSGDARTVAAGYLQPKPRDFTRSSRRVLTRQRMLAAVREGVPGTAMMSFSRVLDQGRMEAVVDYIRGSLMSGAGAQLRYHTAANGWPDHARYRAAFPFVSGEVALDAPLEGLTATQRAGRRLFLSACVSCHEGRALVARRPMWEPYAVSFPRSLDTCIDCHGGRPRELLPPSRAADHPIGPPFENANRNQWARVLSSPYAAHADAPWPDPTDPALTRGRTLFLENCSFCHAADGSGRNWIGSFLEPRPRNLRGPGFMAAMSAERLREVIREGLPGTSMPAWNAVLTGPQIEDLIVFLQQAFGMHRDQAADEEAGRASAGLGGPSWAKLPAKKGRR